MSLSVAVFRGQDRLTAAADVVVAPHVMRAAGVCCTWTSPRNVYVREDVVLAQLGERFSTDRDGVGDGGRRSATELAIRLRLNREVIVCGLIGWTLATDG